jgi:hypothetical protein
MASKKHRTKHNKIMILGGIIVLVVVLVGIYFYNFPSGPSNEVESNNNSQPVLNNSEGSNAELQPASINVSAFKTYSKISQASILDGKLVFVGTTSSSKDVIVYDGKEYGGEYDRVYKPMLIGGRLVYSAYNSGAETIYYIIDGDKIYTDTDEYYSISYPVDIDGKLAFEAYIGGTKAEANGKSIIIYDGKKYGEQYDWANEIFNANGKLGYIAKEGSGVGKTFLVIDGEEIGKEYQHVYSPVMINGKLAYIADDKKLVYDGQVIDEYDRFDHGYRDKSIISVNGKPAAVAVKNSEYFVYYDGKEWKPSKHRTTDKSFTPVYYGIKDLNGKLAFEVRYEFCCPVMGDNPTMEGFVYYNGKEYGLEYDSARSPFEINGKLGYIAKSNGKEFIIVDGKKVTGEFSNIAFAKELSGKLIYAANNGTSYFIYGQ